MRGRMAIMCSMYAKGENNEEGIAVFEMKELFHAHAGCTDRQKHMPLVSIHNLKYSCT